MFSSSSKKPYTAVTVQIEQFTSEGYDENDLSGLPDLIESIRIQSSGTTEAARAIRKKLKYGNVHKQLRALTLLEALVANLSPRHQSSFAMDDALLERLRIAATDAMTDKAVKDKLRIIFVQWHSEFKDKPALYNLANLHKQFPMRKRPRPAPPADSTSPPHSPVMASSSRVASSSTPSRGFGTPPPGADKSKKTKTHSRSGSTSKPFVLQKELPTLMDCLAKASISSTNLKNSLKHINREIQRPSENQECVQKYQEASSLRKQILRYIQNVESEQWLGSLIHANEELVDAILLFKTMDKPIEEDSDSDLDEVANERSARRGSHSRPGISFDRDEDEGPALPQRPGKFEEEEEEEEDDDENNPFSNRYGIQEASDSRW